MFVSHCLAVTSLSSCIFDMSSCFIGMVALFRAFLKVYDNIFGPKFYLLCGEIFLVSISLFSILFLFIYSFIL